MSVRIIKFNQGYDGRYPHIYAALKRYGFSPAMAIRILIDANRDDRYAWRVIHQARRQGVQHDARRAV
jgi:hypothetical protein